MRRTPSLSTGRPFFVAGFQRGASAKAFSTRRLSRLSVDSRMAPATVSPRRDRVAQCHPGGGFVFAPLHLPGDVVGEQLSALEYCGRIVLQRDEDNTVRGFVAVAGYALLVGRQLLDAFDVVGLYPRDFVARRAVDYVERLCAARGVAASRAAKRTRRRIMAGVFCPNVPEPETIVLTARFP